MIPKKIHFCWFSDGEYPDGEYPSRIQKCLASWKKFLPEYEVVCWTTKNFDFTKNIFALEALNAKKWAFVSDYVRLSVLYEYGGIYLDSDVEIVKPFDEDLLTNTAFLGLESEGVITSWLIGSEAKNPLIKEFLEYYKDRHFCINNRYDTTPNTVPLSKICKKHGLTNENIIQDLGLVKVYPEEYFCAKSVIDGKIRITPNTYTIHHFDGGWQSPQDRFIKKMKYLVFSIIGSSMYPRIRSIYRKIRDRS